MADVLYLKIDRNVQAEGKSVCIGDIASVYCSTKSVENKVKTLRLPTEVIRGPGRYVFSVFDVLTVIHDAYPSLQVENLGESDFIITVEKQQRWSDAVSWGKTAFVCVLAFFGAAFSIMAFNNDVGIKNLFGQLYEMFTGQPSNGFTLLEISYSIGVGLGILLFFHHFAKKRGGADPTPLEVEMRTYEDDVDATLIESGNRKEGRRQNV